jgi:AbrB family looped-hinge helix DNA binding protein
MTVLAASIIFNLRRALCWMSEGNFRDLVPSNIFFVSSQSKDSIIRFSPIVTSRVSNVKLEDDGRTADCNPNPVGLSYRVTTTLSQKGQVVIPQEVRNKLRLRPGDDFIVLYSETGDILLRPIRRRNEGGLIKGLRALGGLKVEERTPWDEPVRDVSL